MVGDAVKQRGFRGDMSASCAEITIGSHEEVRANPNTPVVYLIAKFVIVSNLPTLFSLNAKVPVSFTSHSWPMQDLRCSVSQIYLPVRLSFQGPSNVCIN